MTFAATGSTDYLARNLRDSGLSPLLTGRARRSAICKGVRDRLGGASWL